MINEILKDYSRLEEVVFNEDAMIKVYDAVSNEIKAILKAKGVDSSEVTKESFMNITQAASLEAIVNYFK